MLAGALSARRGARGGRAVPAVAVLLVARPVVVVAYVLRTVVGVQLGWLPRAGRFDGALSYVLPVTALAGLSTGFVMLLTRSEVRAALSTPRLRAGRGRGTPQARLLTVHALRPALVPIVAFVAAQPRADAGRADRRHRRRRRRHRLARPADPARRRARLSRTVRHPLPPGGSP